MDSHNQLNELNALISLLDEPDTEIYSKIREKVFSYGLTAVPYLENAWDKAYNNSDLQHRIESIIHDIQFSHVFQLLKNWKSSPTRDLLTGFLHIARYQYPEIKDEDIIHKIGLIIQDVWLELHSRLSPLEKVRILNHILFNVHGFEANMKELHAASNHFINIILQTKRGNAISLGIIYIIVAQSLNIPIYGVNLPQNFILACLDNMIEENKKVTRQNVQFYINPFARGAIYTRGEIELFLRQIGLGSEEKYFLPCNDVEILRRLLGSLIQSYENSGNTEKMDDIQKLLKALE